MIQKQREDGSTVHLWSPIQDNGENIDHARYLEPLSMTGPATIEITSDIFDPMMSNGNDLRNMIMAIVRRCNGLQFITATSFPGTAKMFGEKRCAYGWPLPNLLIEDISESESAA